MHYAVRLKVSGQLDGSTKLPATATVTRGIVTQIGITGNFGTLDLTPLQSPPADKPLFLQCLAVNLSSAGSSHDSIVAEDPEGGPTIELMNLNGVTSQFDATGWILPVGYVLKFTGPGVTSGAEPHYIRLDFWQIENLSEVVAGLRASSSDASEGATSGSSVPATPTGPAGGDLAGTYPNPFVSALRSNATSLTIGDLAAGQFLQRDATLNRIIGVAAPTYDGKAASGDLAGWYPSPKVTALHTSDDVRHALGAIGSGQYLMLASDGTITGGTPSGGSVFGQYYAPSAIANVVSSGTNWTQVTTIEIPAISATQVYRLGWYAEMFIESGTDWGLRFVRTDTNAVVIPTITGDNARFFERNLQQYWQIPYCGFTLLSTVAGAYTIAMQVRSSTGEKAWARNAAMEVFRVK